MSVGEINATRELVRRLTCEDAPPMRVVISSTTNTGFERARQLYEQEQTVVRTEQQAAYVGHDQADEPHQSAN